MTFKTNDRPLHPPRVNQTSKRSFRSSGAIFFSFSSLLSMISIEKKSRVGAANGELFASPSEGISLRDEIKEK